MSSLHRLLLGTANRKKAEELVHLFTPLGLHLETLADLPEAIAVEETGATFSANARLKAVTLAKRLKRWVLGEDSGLMVEALGGAPGVLSARFSGPDATDASNNRLLLEQLGARPLEQRAARFVCHMALADPTGAIRAETEGACCGRILFEPRGSYGFGYDPLFEILEYHRTMAELGPHTKACLSHRGRAARLMVPKLRELIEAGQWLE